jgi:hypothetical protein
LERETNADQERCDRVILHIWRRGEHRHVALVPLLEKATELSSKVRGTNQTIVETKADEQWTMDPSVN